MNIFMWPTPIWTSVLYHKICVFTNIFATSMSFQVSLSLSFRWLRVKQLSHYDWCCAHANRRGRHFVFSAGPLALHQAPQQEVYLRAASPRWVSHLRNFHISCSHFPCLSPLPLSCVRQTGFDADEPCRKEKVFVQQCSRYIRFQIWYLSVKRKCRLMMILHNLGRFTFRLLFLYPLVCSRRGIYLDTYLTNNR